MHGVVLGTVSSSISILFCHEAEESDNMVVGNQPAGLNKLKAFTQSFKHFKDGFFKVVVKLAGQSHFYTADGNTKFSFFWTGNPWRYKVVSREDLSVVEKDVVDTLMQFSDKMPTKGLVRVYNSVHPIIDIEGIFL